MEMTYYVIIRLRMWREETMEQQFLASKTLFTESRKWPTWHTIA